MDEFLGRPLFAHLGSVSVEGHPRVSPVWFLWEEEAIWILGNRRSDTFPDRVAGEPRCALAIEDYDRTHGTVQHVGMRGLATIEPFDTSRAKRLLRRYLGPDEAQWDGIRFIDSLAEPDNVLVRVEPETTVVRDVSYRPPWKQPPPRLRVACYVTRWHVRQMELLVFDHTDFPGAGTQVPAGGVDDGETFREAALREVCEETGLDRVEVVRLLGESDRAHPEDESAQSTTYVHLRLTGEAPERWQHVARGRGEDADLRFDCRWVPLPVTLADDQHALIERLDELADTHVQDRLDRAVREALLTDDRVVAALAYGSRVKDEDDAHSDVEYWIVADEDWTVAGMLQEVEPPLSLSRNQFGSDVAIWSGLVRGEFHPIRPDQLHLIAAWPQRDAQVERMVIKDDAAGRLATTLASLPERLLPPTTPSEVVSVCEQFANWWLMSWHLRLRGERERSRLVSRMARDGLISMARLRHGATDHWLSHASRFEIELPARLVTQVRSLMDDDLDGLWCVGRQLWLELAVRHDFEVPVALLAEIDEALTDA